MSIYTRKLDKKKAQEKSQAQNIENLYERAFKGLPRPDTPAGAIAGLERYMVSLERLKEETLRRYGENPHFQDALYWINKELDSAADEIVRKKIQILQNERIGI